MDEKREIKIDRDTAVAEFERFCEMNEIDYDESAMTAEDAEAFKPLKERFVKACMGGRVEVDGRNIGYTISSLSDDFAGDTVMIKRPTGHAFMAMDNYSDKQSVHKLQGFVSAMTGKEVKYFSKIDISDWLFFRDVATLFLSV